MSTDTEARELVRALRRDPGIIDSLPGPEALRIAKVLKQLTPSDATSRTARDDPRDFIVQVLGQKPTPAALSHGITVPWTPDQDAIMVSVRDNKHTAVVSGNSSGKTNIAAKIALWFSNKHQPSKVITTATTWHQVKDLLWSEIRTSFLASAIPLPGRLMELRLEMSPEHFVIGISTKPERGDIGAASFQGFHSKAVLVIFDEGEGIQGQLYDAAETMLTGPDDRFLVIGNPTISGSRFHQICENSRWNVINVSCENHPNVVYDDPGIIPGAATREWVEDRLEVYGSRDAPLFQAQVLGIWPAQSTDKLVSLAWFKEAQERGATPRADDGKGLALGMDVAREGGDLTVIKGIRNAKLFMPKINGKFAWHVGQEVDAAMELAIQACIQLVPEVFCIDDTGIGGAVTAGLRLAIRDGRIPKVNITNELPSSPTSQEHKRPIWVCPMNFGATAYEEHRFQLLKDELWWSEREALRLKTLDMPTPREIASWGLPRGSDLQAQLCSPIYDLGGRQGRIRVMDKKTSQGGGGVDAATGKNKTAGLPTKSPDLGHAAMLATWAWTKLRAHVAPAIPRTQVELYSRQLEDEIGRALGMDKKKRGAGSLTQWKMGRR